MGPQTHNNCMGDPPSALLSANHELSGLMWLGWQGELPQSGFEALHMVLTSQCGSLFECVWVSSGWCYPNFVAKGWLLLQLPVSAMFASPGHLM